MNDLKKAISKAVDECIQEGILQEILETQKEEVYQMMLTEFDEEKYEAIIRAEGREEGKNEERLKNARNLRELGVDLEIISKATGLTADEIISL